MPAVAVVRQHHGLGLPVGPGLPRRRSVCLWQMAVYSLPFFKDAPLGPSDGSRCPDFLFPGSSHASSLRHQRLWAGCDPSPPSTASILIFSRSILFWRGASYINVLSKGALLRLCRCLYPDTKVSVFSFLKFRCDVNWPRYLVSVWASLSFWTCA